jgi:transglutaminase-like putative cysteine protease
MRFAVLILLLLPLATAIEYPFDATLYDAASLRLSVDVASNVTLQGSGTAKELEATVHYVPEDATFAHTTPTPVETQPLTYRWERVGPGTYPFSYSALLETRARRPLIREEIPYPFTTPAEFTPYLQAQEITNTNRAIRQQARVLAEGKTDSMEVVFAIADWVHQNVEYNLTTVTAQASQPSSWVYEERYGVCDELTSLFISMSREAGIPARFVSGIAYTNQFQNNWGPHGWAEVWLPNIGWVPVDVTYGEIGYLDATHIPVHHSLDARSNAVEYSLLAQSLTMRAAELTVDTTVLEREGTVEEPLSITLEPLYDRVGSESGNIITATVRNNAPYYVATDLYLATTTDTTIYEKQRQQVLLPPRSTRAVSWRITMPHFDRQYEYTVPFAVIANRAGNASTTVNGNTAAKSYPLAPSSATSVSSLLIECDEAPVLYSGETASVTCASAGAQLCAKTCARDAIAVQFQGAKPGAYPILVNATKGSAHGSAIITFVVEEQPHPTITATLPATLHMEDTSTLTFTVRTARITDAVVEVQSGKLYQRWEVPVLEEKGFQLQFAASYLLAGENEVHITVHGNDKNGVRVEGEATVPVTLEATTWERITLVFIHLFL